MSLSIRAQAETVHPIVGDYFDIVFPLVLDLSTADADRAARAAMEEAYGAGLVQWSVYVTRGG